MSKLASDAASAIAGFPDNMTNTSAYGMAEKLLSPLKNRIDPVELEQAICLLAASALHIAYDTKRTDRTLRGTIGFLCDPEKERRGIFEEMKNYQHDRDHSQNWKDVNGYETTTHPNVSIVAKMMLSSDPTHISRVFSIILYPLMRMAFGLDSLSEPNSTVESFEEPNYGRRRGELDAGEEKAEISGMVGGLTHT